ncbi:MAG: type III-A CRISPR-associated protein Csm2 [Desulfovibrio sp.]|nr:type III-A CRISPR-associated protein Csm2 [Desulfovibrio sp.]
MSIAYYDSNNAMDPSLVDEQAQQAAKSFFPDNSQSEDGKGRSKEGKGRSEEGKGQSKEIALNSSQLRKFYSDVKTLERRWLSMGGDDQAFAQIIPMIKLLKAKSDYALKRKVVPSSFKAWLWNHVDSIKTSRDFKAFLLHFEAVVGFSYKFFD